MCNASFSVTVSSGQHFAAPTYIRPASIHVYRGDTIQVHERHQRVDGYTVNTRFPDTTRYVRQPSSRVRIIKPRSDTLESYPILEVLLPGITAAHTLQSDILLLGLWVCSI